MLKRFLAASTILLATASFANDYPALVPYIGANIGAIYPSWHLKDTSHATTNFNANGIMGGLFAGAGMFVEPKLYLGAEGFGNQGYATSSNKVINTSSGAASDSISMRYSYGGSVIPGFQFNDSIMGYLRIGVIRTRFNLHQTIVPAGATSNLSKNTVTGAQYGIGLQGCLTKSFLWRAEYDYSTYRSFRGFDNLIHAYNNTFSGAVVYELS